MSIYDAIGGGEFVEKAVEEFYAKLQSNPVIAEFFEGADLAKLETHQRMFLTAALGGPDAYEGRDMRAAHAHLHITDVDFEVFLDYLAETMAEVGATQARINKVLEALKPLQFEIVSAPHAGPDEFGSQDPTGGGD